MIENVEKQEGEMNVIMIDSDESYQKNIHKIKQSKQLGVDLEGDLSK